MTRAPRLPVRLPSAIGLDALGKCAESNGNARSSASIGQLLQDVPVGCHARNPPPAWRLEVIGRNMDPGEGFENRVAVGSFGEPAWRRAATAGTGSPFFAGSQSGDIAEKRYRGFRLMARQAGGLARRVRKGCGAGVRQTGRQGRSRVSARPDS